MKLAHKKPRLSTRKVTQARRPVPSVASLARTASKIVAESAALTAVKKAGDLFSAIPSTKRLLTARDSECYADPDDAKRTRSVTINGFSKIAACCSLCEAAQGYAHHITGQIVELKCVYLDGNAKNLSKSNVLWLCPRCEEYHHQTSFAKQPQQPQTTTKE